MVQNAVETETNILQSKEYLQLVGRHWNKIQ